MISTKLLIENEEKLRMWGQFEETSHVKISTDTRKLKKGEAFICLKGKKFDSFSFIDKIIEKGAAVVVYEGSEKIMKE